MAGRLKGNAAVIVLPAFRQWRQALGMPLWLIMEASDLGEAVIYKAERRKPITRATARLLSIALEIPLDLLSRVGPDHEEARAIAARRAAEVRQELTSRNAAREARRFTGINPSREAEHTLRSGATEGGV
jgi:hypothetical protein